MRVIKVLFICVLSLFLSSLFLSNSYAASGKAARDVGEDLIPAYYEHLDLFREKVEGREFFPPCYQDEGLAKVREWEKKWVGKKIDSTNVDEVKDLIPETYYQRLKDPKTWGEFYFTITPYFYYRPSEGYMEATKKYGGQCTIGSQDEILGWTAGLPFPKWKSPLEFAWNMERAYWADDWLGREYHINIADGKRHTERITLQNVNRLYYVGRTDLEPIPSYPKEENREGIRYGDLLYLTKPADIKGLAVLVYRYADCSRDDDQWTYVPAMRRIRRMSTAQRTDSAAGTDLCWDDYHGYCGMYNKQTYKMLGRKELLLNRHQDVGEYKRPKGYLNFSNIWRSRVNAHVVEVHHKDPNYIYGKRIWYVDPESYVIMYAVDYDPEGRLWKTVEFFNRITKKQMFNPGGEGIDYQRIHGTPYYNLKEENLTVNIGQRPYDVSLKFLLEQAH